MNHSCLKLLLGRSANRLRHLLLLISLALSLLAAPAYGQPRELAVKPNAAIPRPVILRIVRAEDERRWDSELQTLVTDNSANIRRRAVLAAGRIGDERAVAPLIQILQKDTDLGVRAMAAFALGEIESPAAADALVGVLNLTQPAPSEIRARAIEALGKIAAALPKKPQGEEARGRPMKDAIRRALELEAERSSRADDDVILAGLTAALRARPENVAKPIVHFLSYSGARIRADAANTLARLKLPDGNEKLRELLKTDPEPVVRANAARVLGATEARTAFDALLDRALTDSDLRVRVSAIRALGTLKDPRAVEPMTGRGESLLAFVKSNGQSFVNTQNELLEIAVLLGRLPQNNSSERSIALLRELHQWTSVGAPEFEVAFASVAPAIFQSEPFRLAILRNRTPWRRVAARAQGLAAIKEVIVGAATGSPGDSALKDAQKELRTVLTDRYTPSLALPDVMNAYASYAPKDLAEVVRPQLANADVIIRGAVAESLGKLPPDPENNQALIAALKPELSRVEQGEMNDAALAILDALAKQKNEAANEAIKSALDHSNHLIRRKAAGLLKENGAGDFSNRIGTVKTGNTAADYERAIDLIGKQVHATVRTSKGLFVIELLAEDAPLTVANFVMLARKGFFNGQTVPRVVPNFVIQTGDPRGDQNGGPGYQIRCEINEVPYERGAVGMALSGKDTGGSQWFVTHSPQPHLDGGYTVFGRVISGMEVVDNIVRGDIIRSIIIQETAPVVPR